MKAIMTDIVKGPSCVWFNRLKCKVVSEVPRKRPKSVCSQFSDQLLVQRTFTSSRVDDVKTEYSEDYVPLHPSLTEIVLKWSTHAVATEEGWVFFNRRRNRSYYPAEIQKRHLRPSGCCVVGCPTCGAAPGVWCNQDQKTGKGVRMLLHDTRVKDSGKYGTTAGTRSATRIVRGWTRPERR